MVRVLKVGEFDAGDAGNIGQGGNAMKEEEKTGGGEMGLLRPELVDGIVDRVTW